MMALYVALGCVAFLYVCMRARSKRILKRKKRRIVPTALGPMSKFEIYHSHPSKRDIRSSTI